MYVSACPALGVCIIQAGDKRELCLEADPAEPKREPSELPSDLQCGDWDRVKA